MAEITAAAVKALRDKTGLPMMECKEALRSHRRQTKPPPSISCASRAKRRWNPRSAAKPRPAASPCTPIPAKGRRDDRAAVRKRPGRQHEEFIALANDLAKQLATGPGAKTADELLEAAVARQARQDAGR